MDDRAPGISSESAIQFSFKELESNRIQELLRLAVDVFVSGLLYAAVILSIQSMFEIYSISVFAAVPGLMLILVMSYFHSNQRIISGVSIAVFAAVIGCSLLWNEYVMNGLLLIMNQIALVVGAHTEVMMRQYQIAIDADSYGLAISGCVTVFSLMLAYLCSFAMKHGIHLLIWLLILPLFLFQLISGITPAIYYNAALFLAGILLANYSFILGSNRNKLVGGSKNSIMIFSTSLMLVLFTVSFLLLNMLEPLSGYTKSSAVLGLKRSVIEAAEDFRYEKNQTNTFTQGDFRELGTLELLDSPALKVVMSEPASLYLRGYVGSTYTGEAWKPLDYGVYNDSYGLFYWLRESQFNALNQLSDVEQLASDRVKREEKLSITINNVNANSKYLYTPYELQTDPNRFDDVKTFDDSMIVSTSFFGNRLYDYQSSENLVKQYPALANDLYALKDRKQAESYFKNESYYNEYVHKNYTAIPKEAELLIKNHVEDQQFAGGEMNYEDRVKFVKSYVADTLTYNAEVEPLPESVDFLQYLLEESREGYAAHYATMATMLLRYAGVPARYVEGYLITPEDIKEASPFEEITITGKNAHAWTEIYLDGMGWVPVEVTPPYYDVMEKNDISDYPKGNFDPTTDSESVGNASNTAIGSNVADQSQKQQVKDDEPMPANTTNKKPKKELSLLLKLLIGGFIVCSLLFAAYVVYAIMKRRDVNKRNRSFQDPDRKAAIPKMFAYSVALLQYAGLHVKGGSMYSYCEEVEAIYSKEYAEQFRKMIMINQECLYSDHETNEKKYEAMKRFMKETLSKLIKSKNVFQRLKMKLWDFLY